MYFHHILSSPVVPSIPRYPPLPKQCPFYFLVIDLCLHSQLLTQDQTHSICFSESGFISLNMKIFSPSIFLQTAQVCSLSLNKTLLCACTTFSSAEFLTNVICCFSGLALLTCIFLIFIQFPYHFQQILYQAFDYCCFL